MITNLNVFDFDGTLSDSALAIPGKEMWEKKYNIQYPHIGWWGRLESLDINVFGNKLFPNLVNVIKKDIANTESYVIILTNRLPRFENRINEILSENGIHVDKIDTKRDERTKGDRLLEYVNQFPDLKFINVYEDDNEKIQELISIKTNIDKKIEYNVYRAENGNMSLVYTSNILVEMIFEELLNMKI